LEEEQLIEAAKRDPERFRPLYQKYFKTIFLFIHHKVDDKEVTADLTSQVFLKALLHLPGYKSQGLPFSAWLYRIATNEVMQYFRSTKQVRKILVDEELLSRLHEETEEPTLEALQTKLETVLPQLSLDEIQLIELRFYDARPFREIAFILNISENTAKVRSHRVVEKLRKKMLQLR
jgi:RNA polymerase sigma-70 factor (ECF subfamily)